MKSAIIVASGIGSRFGSDIPKQFLLINNTMVIEYTIQTFLKCVDILVLVVSNDYIKYIQTHFKDSKIHYCVGGQSRQESVYNGLNYLQTFNPQLVAIHDGVRMLVSEELINQSFATAQQHNSAIPIVSVTDSLWHNDSFLSQRCNRDEFVCSQTPQTFNYQQILSAHQKTESSLNTFSDCAGVYVASFGKVATYKGDKNNIKLTTIEDMEYLYFKIINSNINNKN